MQEIVYFSLNNWSPEVDYPNVEPYKTWMDDYNKDFIFTNEEYIKENKLCVKIGWYDMSKNVLVSAPKEWVDKNCPSLLTEFSNFVYKPKEDEVFEDRFGWTFLEYNEKNIGCFVYDEDEDRTMTLKEWTNECKSN